MRPELGQDVRLVEQPVPNRLLQPPWCGGELSIVAQLVAIIRDDIQARGDAVLEVIVRPPVRGIRNETP